MRIQQNFLIAFLNILIIQFCFQLYFCDKEVLSIDQDLNEKYLIISTIDGQIHLVDRYNGDKIWSTVLDPITTTRGSDGTMLITNPLNGRLFIFQNNENNEIFTSLDKTMFEYVRQTPVFFDGQIMTGSKNDRWMIYDMDNGNLLHQYKSEEFEKCPQHNASSIVQSLQIGICQYKLIVKEPVTGRTIYDLTLNSLATHAVTDVPKNNLRLYSSSNSGLVAAKYTENNIEKGWSASFESTVISFYGITPNGILTRVPHTSMSHETVVSMFLSANTDKPEHMTLKKAMYFGHTNNSWYVLTTFIHKNYQARQLFRHKLPLITGPINSTIPFIYQDKRNNQYSGLYDSYPITGFYEPPPEVYHKNIYGHVVPVSHLLDFDRLHIYNSSSAVVMKPDYHVQSQIVKYEHSLSWSLFLLFVFLIVFISIICNIIISKLKEQTKINKEFNDASSDSVTVGDIIYYSSQILGHGTNGTVVFKGSFKGNNKEVAVKRLIKTVQSQYELEFLRQSFDCSQLIKCFYITHTMDFTYLALELCDCTLESYVTDADFRNSTCLDKFTIYKQMMTGVLFLHEKGIVHRDLKPRNVLLMKENSVNIRQNGSSTSINEQKVEAIDTINEIKQNYKVVISDFGLSRQSNNKDGDSITKTISLLVGTSGYIAPELMREDITRITPAADIFSCGILFYFIHSNGKHPFGSDIHCRQHRINEGDFCIDRSLFQEANNNYLYFFIKKMIKMNASERPRADEILYGPLFWNEFTKLSLLCDLSDFIEKGDEKFQKSLNKYSRAVFPDKWTEILDEELINSLIAKRTYHAYQLTHLIRALRNKRNHFHELSTDTSQLFDNSITGYSHYINTKFPLLYPILYGWVRYDLVNLPDSFQHYFPKNALPFILEESTRLTAYQNKTENESSDKEDSKIQGTDEIENEDDGSYIWKQKQSKRRRPNQEKKIRGNKANKKVDKLN